VNWLHRLYPRWWRARYGDEFQMLLQERGLSAAVILDVARGALDAWLHADLVRPAVAEAGGTRGQRRARFDKFTPHSRAVLHLAEQEARRLHHGHIGTEHLLLGLVALQDGLVAETLRQHDAGDLASLRGHVQRLLTSSSR
jgi:hypothetical protein